ncbi:MAG: trypsin-like peptidase domain-containing protein [Ruminococcus sp.]|nr:trypsin-like peptidase domain-containing protein [Ruminococcus sp.]
MKKLMSGFVAVCVSMITVLSSVASASFNPNKDPNGNGYMSISDSVYIDQYLIGHHEPTDLSQLDVDDNDVVSTVDSEYVQMYDAGIISNVPGEIDNRSNINTTYYVYNAQTGAYKRNYALSVPIDDNTPADRGGEEEGNSRGIVGTTDDRIPDWSNRGTAKIICSEVSAGYRGSGFVVGPHTIATAAHVVFDTTSNYAYSLDDILLFDADHTDHSFTPVEYHVPLSFINSTGYTEIGDYALITVEEDMSDYISFNLGSVTDSSATNNLTVATVGFPRYMYYNIQGSNSYSSTLINNATTHDERLSTGSVTYTNSNIIHFTADTSGGNSGGPIYAVESLNGVTYHTVIGINVSQPTLINVSYNTGVRFNASILKFYKANSNIQY